MYGVTAYLKMVKKGATASEILEFIGGLFFVPLKGGMGENLKEIKMTDKSCLSSVGNICAKFLEGKRTIRIP